MVNGVPHPISEGCIAGKVEIQHTTTQHATDLPTVRMLLRPITHHSALHRVKDP